MIKGKCRICSTKKAKRVCRIKDGIGICPECCAKMRYEMCDGCGYYSAAKQYEKERRNIKHFMALIDPDIEKKCDKALTLAESGEVPRAEVLLKALYEKHPAYHTVVYGMGVCSVLQGRTEEAIEYFKRAVEIFPYFTEAYFNLAMAYKKLVKLPEAVRTFREVISIGSDEGLVSKAKEVLDDLERMVKGDHISLDAYIKNMETFEAAFSAMQKKEFVPAIELFSRVLLVNPKNVQSWGNMGLAYACLGHKSKAIECLDKALEIDPEYELAIVNREFVSRDMEEGKGIDWEGDSVEYYKEYNSGTKRSYIPEVVDSMKASE